MIGVLGSGSWATAVVKMLLDQSEARVAWYVREKEIRASLSRQGRNHRYLPEVYISPDRIQLFDAPQPVVDLCPTVYLIVPSAYLHGVMQQVDASQLRQRKWVSAIKGFVSEDDMIVTEYLKQTYGALDGNLAIISGPTHAEEVARERLTFITAASTNLELAHEVVEQIKCRYISVTPSTDVCGIQYATALKNIYALSAGICKGLGCGDNLMAVLVSIAMVEMCDFLQAMVPGISPSVTARNMPPYIGDLLATCYSQLSRNRTFGAMIGRGYTVKSAQLEMHMVAEGYYAAKSLQHLCQRRGIHMPIAQTVYRILYENQQPETLLDCLNP